MESVLLPRDAMHCAVYHGKLSEYICPTLWPLSIRPSVWKGASQLLTRPTRHAVKSSHS